MDKQENIHKEIWAAGAKTSLDSLLEEICRQGGCDSAHSKDTISITWLSNELLITRDANGFWIHPHSRIMKDPVSWNQCLERFYAEVVEPLKDKTGGVAAGIGIRSDK